MALGLPPFVVGFDLFLNSLLSGFLLSQVLVSQFDEFLKDLLDLQSIIAKHVDRVSGAHYGCGVIEEEASCEHCVMQVGMPL